MNVLRIIPLLVLVSACTGPDTQVFTPRDLAEARAYDKRFYVTATEEREILFVETTRISHVTIRIVGKDGFGGIAATAPGTPFSVHIGRPLPDHPDIPKLHSLERDALQYARVPFNASAARRLGIAVAEATFCRGGTVTANDQTGPTPGGPADTARIVAATSGRILDGRVSEAVEGRPTAAIAAYRGGGWLLSARCVGATWQ